MIKYTDLKLTGYPATREMLREHFRQIRSEKRVCPCTRCLNHIDSNWVAVRTPRGHHIIDYMFCDGCVDREVKKVLENPLTDTNNATIFVVLVRGSELFF
jgi:hypothetical protein